MKDLMSSFRKSHHKKIVSNEFEPLQAERPPSPAQLLFQTALFSMIEPSSPVSLEMTERVAFTPPTVHHTPHKRTKAKYRDPEILLMDSRVRSSKI